MRYEIAIPLLSAALIGAGWHLRRHFLRQAIVRLAPMPPAQIPLKLIRRRPF